MEIDVSRQLMQLGASWLCGFVLGAVYDVFRVLRRNLKASALFDGLFCLAALFALFTLGMEVGDGSLHIFMLAFFALGFASYMLLLSDIVLVALNKAAQLIRRAFAPIARCLKIICVFVKKCFSNAKNRFRIERKKREKGRTEAGEENALHSGGGTDRADRVCYPEPQRRSERFKAGTDGNGRA